MQNSPAQYIARLARSGRSAPQFWPIIAPIEPERPSRGTTAKLCNRPAAPKPATAASPWLASSAVRTDSPIGLIAFEKAAGPATRRIARLESAILHPRIFDGAIAICVLRMKKSAMIQASPYPMMEAYAAPATPNPSKPSAPVIRIGSRIQFATE